MTNTQKQKLGKALAEIAIEYDFSDGVLTDRQYVSLSNDVTDKIGDTIDIDDIYSQQQIKDYITKNFKPDDVFSPDTLIDWAHGAGMFKE